MYTVEQINNSFIVKRDGVPLFGGASIDYYVQKDDIFSLSIISLIHPKDRFSLSIEEMGKDNITDLFIDVVKSIYGIDAANDITGLNTSNDFYINSIGKIFIMARLNIPYFCGPRNSVIIRTDSQQVYVYNRYSLDLIQVLRIEDTGKVDIVALYEEIVDHGHGEDPADSRGLNYIGAWDAHTNIPDFTVLDHQNGDYYKVSVSGSTDIDGINDWINGDWVLYNGVIWEKIDQSELISSVNGEVGTIILNPDHLDDTSSTNKFTTQTEKDKLTTIENNATGDQTGIEIKTSYENNDDTNAFSDAYKAKLDGIEENADVNNILDINADSLVSGLESVLHKHDYTKLLNKPFIPSNLNDLAGNLDNIVDGLTFVKTTNDYTTLDKEKLASLENSKFLGLYVDLISLQEAHSSPAIGSFAYIDSGIGVDTKVYIWDNNNTIYVELVGDVATETSESIKTKYESNTDTNAFSDMYKDKLDGIEEGALASGGHDEFSQVVEDLAIGTQNGIIVAINNTFQLMSIEDFLNSVPKIVSIPNYTSVYNGDIYTYQIDATGINLLYSLSNFPTGMTISASGLIQYTAIPGTYTDIVIIIENSFGTAKQNIDLNVIQDQEGSKIKHDNLNDIVTGDTYTPSGNWFNQNNIKIFKNNNHQKHPTLLTSFLNSKDVLSFDGNDDHIRNYNSYSKTIGSVIILFHPIMDDYQYGQIFGDYSEGLNVALNNINLNNKFSFNGSSNNKAKYTLDGTNYTGFIDGGNLYPWVNNEWNKIYVEYENPTIINNMTIGSLYPDHSLGSYQYKGYIALIAIYDSALTNQQVTETFNWIHDEYGI